MIADVSNQLMHSQALPDFVRDEPSFSNYIANCRNYILKTRKDLNYGNSQLILDANSPFEVLPDKKNLESSTYEYGALLVHGLLDSPFSFRDIATKLQANGILSRAVLLPGHGTRPEELIQATYQDWLQTVRYGIESLKKDVKHLYLIGYSMGAALSVYHALKDPAIAGIVMLSPAVAVKTPVSVVITWHRLLSMFTRNKNWIYFEKEIDYAKYRSVCFNAYNQVLDLLQEFSHATSQHALTVPVYSIMSSEDETVSTPAALQYFKTLPNPRNQFLLYTNNSKLGDDPRIRIKPTAYPALQIKHFSHVAIPFAPTNHHYGQQGDYINASHLNNAVYGGYNKIEINYSTRLYKMGLIKTPHKELTYNPDFEYMAQSICDFILSQT